MLHAWQLQGQDQVVHLSDQTRELSVDCLHYVTLMLVPLVTQHSNSHS